MKKPFAEFLYSHVFHEENTANYQCFLLYMVFMNIINAAPTEFTGCLFRWNPSGNHTLRPLPRRSSCIYQPKACWKAIDIYAAGISSCEKFEPHYIHLFHEHFIRIIADLP